MSLRAARGLDMGWETKDTVFLPGGKLVPLDRAEPPYPHTYHEDLGCAHGRGAVVARRTRRQEFQGLLLSM